MISKNIKNLRKAKGLSQEELAVKLNVVRQTISKWETGASVPDSEMLILLAEELDSSVSDILGENIVPDENSELKVIADKLEILNKQFAEQSAHSRKNRIVLFSVLFLISLLFLGFVFAGEIFSWIATNELLSSPSVIGGSDRQTDIFVINIPLKIILIALAMIFTVISAVCLYKELRNERK